MRHELGVRSVLVIRMLVDVDDWLDRLAASRCGRGFAKAGGDRAAAERAEGPAIHQCGEPRHGSKSC
jgi:hypothetical protein